MKKLDHAEETALYAAARRIGELWFEAVAEEAAAGSDITSQSYGREPHINAYYDRTASGLYVEWYYGSPNKVLTPWGFHRFNGGVFAFDKATERAVERFMKRVELHLSTPGKQDDIGYIGPFYEVIAVDGIAQPKAEMANQRENSSLYEENNATWKRLTSEYASR